MSLDMDATDTTGKPQTRTLKRVAVIAAVTLVLLIVIAVGIYFGAFMILSPMMG
jgi:hypothetical protein